jgi:hypothetical protein
MKLGQSLSRYLAGATTRVERAGALCARLTAASCGRCGRQGGAPSHSSPTFAVMVTRQPHETGIRIATRRTAADRALPGL